MSVRLQRQRTTLGKAFTLVEVAVAISLTLAATGIAYYSFEMVYRESAVARLFTEATAIAQNHIELFQTDGPFNPQLNQVPDILTLGTQQQSDVVIYTDPADDSIVVTGTLTTEVTDSGFTSGSPAVSLNARQIKITLTYTYRGHNYIVIMDTIRTSDV